ncbi:MAG: hypothetical protein KF866_07950 [Phycisphaeraceae bacterium]|nr:hypothetical protein [Phycisphaeraceae bacterium]MCW5753808.1 hypothetical protein [Phycisphaeraceae bacterium]
MTKTTITTRSGVRRTRLASAGFALVCLTMLPSCQRQLFDAPAMSQFERYDRWRDDYQDPYTYDAWGDRRPNLRARLSQPR